MKSALTIIALILALAAINGSAIAQGNKSIGGALDVAMPLGDFGDVANTGFGGVFTFQYAYKPNFHFLFDLGYTAWGGKNNIYELDYSWDAVPVQFGCKYYFSPAVNRFYIGGLAGFHRFSVDIPFYNPYTGTTETISSSDTKFGIAPMGGYEFGIGTNLLLDLGARYQMVDDNLSYFGIRAGIICNLR